LFSPKSSIKKQVNNITFVGTICEKKGIRQLIMAMKLICNKFPDVKLNIYGREWYYKDGRSYTEMLRNKYNHIVDEYVTFHGVIPFEELPEKYALANVCVFPSHMETQGLVAQEAMAMQKAVVFSKLGPGNETIEDFETGLLCDPHNINDIAEKVIWFLDNEDKQLTIVKKAREFILNTFNVQATINKNILYYQSLIEV
jgi:glycosyltransferase involved in cell wall biosynthesis